MKAVRGVTQEEMMWSPRQSRQFNLCKAIPENTLFCKTFRAFAKKGKGGFGLVYEGENIETHQPVAIKVEAKHTSGPQLGNEYSIYQILDGGFGFAKTFGFDEKGETRALIMELLGRSLDELLVVCGGHFSIKTVLLLANEMINRIQYLHEKCYLHRDIKPGNFLIGHQNILYLIDFGVSGRYCDVNTHIHIPMRTGKQFVGTDKYASINAHLGRELSRRDDLESLGYVFVYLLKGKLPWQSMTRNKDVDMILPMKKGLSVSELCGGLPPEFAAFLESVKRLEFNERPCYKAYKKMFRQRLLSNGYSFDFDYDWTRKSSDDCLSCEESTEENCQEDSFVEMKKQSLDVDSPLEIPTVFLLEQFDVNHSVISIPGRPRVT